MTIEIDPELERLLSVAARRHGQDINTYAVAKLREIAAPLSVTGDRDAALAALMAWSDAAKQATSEEIAAAERDLADFKRRMNQNRRDTGEEPLYR